MNPEKDCSYCKNESNDNLTNSEPLNWKNELRDDLLASIIGNPSDRTKAIEKVGYAYYCYAPSSVYKYFPPNLERFKSIQNNRLWYSAPIRFNDVFDSDFPIDREAIFKSFLSQVPGGRGVRAGSPMWKQLRSEMPRNVKEFKDCLNQVRSTTGVACFSESFDSLLMWSHYAQNHQGMCVEYELLKFNSELGFSPVPVVYSNKRVQLSSLNINSIENSTLEFLIMCLTSKSTEWSYENEWRIIRDKGACGVAWDDANHGALLPSISPNSIILGCDASREFAKTVQRYCETSGVNLFRMEKDESEYRLIKKPILQFDT